MAEADDRRVHPAIALTEAQAADLAELFPDVPAPYAPCGRWVLVQEKRVAEKTRAGLILPDQAKQADELGMTIGKVVGIGPRAQHDPFTGEPYEDKDFEIGDFVRLPRFDAERPKEGKVIFRLVDEQRISAVILDVSVILR